MNIGSFFSPLGAFIPKVGFVAIILLFNKRLQEKVDSAHIAPPRSLSHARSFAACTAREERGREREREMKKETRTQPRSQVSRHAGKQDS